MKLLFDHQIFQLQRRGGASRLFYELMAKLTMAEDLQIRLFGGLYRSDLPLTELENNQIEVVGFHQQKDSGNKIKSKLNRLGLFFQDFSYQPDIYHPTFYVDGLPNTRAKKVATSLDMIHELFPNLFSENDKTSLRKKALFERSDKIVAISNHTKKDMMEIWNIPSEKIHVIPLAQSLERPAKAYQSRSGRPYILYVGLRDGYKNFERLLRSYSSSGCAQDFDLIAFGGPRLNGTESSFIKENSLQSKVLHFTGGDDFLAQLYAGARLFVYPSLYEGFGIPPLEAMALGCPVLAANSSSIPEVVDNAAMLFDPENGEELVQKLRTALYDDNLLNKMVQLGFLQEKKFSWEKHAEQHLQLYRELV